MGDEWVRGLSAVASGIYLAATIYLGIYGIHLYLLIYLFHRRRNARLENQRRRIERFQSRTPDEQWPIVTSQIPLYNEASVAERVVEAVAAIEYPAGRHEVQILDDSTDETRAIVDRAAAELRARGKDVVVIRRPDRHGFKAGALAYGMRLARGEAIALFDADFVPKPDFLRRALPLLMDDARNGCVQGRWDHLNADESWLTRGQSVAIDGHFTIEQGGRCWNGLPLNFNGTAGVWKREAIEDPAVGGWHADTLTEDLDLSYRAQMAGWRIEYCMDLPCPAELPDTIPALKAQQYRWAKGSIQTARKLLGTVWRHPMGLGRKLEATLHLTAYSIAVWMLLVGLLSWPMLGHGWMAGLGAWKYVAWLLAPISLTAPPFAFCYARRVLKGGWSGLAHVPYLMLLGAGLCINNTVAFFDGMFNRGGVFVRTPKSGGQRAKSRYRAATSSIWIAELVLSLYFLVSYYRFAQAGVPFGGLFLLVYAVGLACVGWLSRPVRAGTTVGRKPVPSTASTVDALPAMKAALVEE